MRALLDTHFLIWLGDSRRAVPARFLPILDSAENDFAMSAASFWELKLKLDAGKLELRQALPNLCLVLEEMGVSHLPVTHAHAAATLTELPRTKDPFDRLLLAQCQTEGMSLLTTDRALRAHPLALRV